MAGQYQIAISFAGEQRPYAEEVARFLQRRGVSVFYDAFERSRLWGRNLAEELYRVYANESSYILMLVSKEYIEKTWCVHERRAAFDKVMNGRADVILPVKFDDAWPDGLPTSTGWQESSTKPAVIASLIFEKLGIEMSSTKLSDVPPPRLSSMIAEVAFDYTNFNGRYVIGAGKAEFETLWSTSGGNNIQVLNDPPSISGIAIAEGAKEFEDLTDVSRYDFSSRIRRPYVGEFIVFRNVHGFYAVARIKAVEAKSHGGKKYEVRIFYVIAEDGKSDFSGYGVFE
jgi:hypothetical protein